LMSAPSHPAHCQFLLLFFIDPLIPDHRSDYVNGPTDGMSDSEMEDNADNRVELATKFVGRGNRAEQKSAIRLKEVSCAERLRLVTLPPFGSVLLYTRPLHHPTNVVFYQIGPRMCLSLLKIEEEFCGGKVIFHSLVEKSADEVIKMEKAKKKKEYERERRKEVSRRNKRQRDSHRAN
jgi:hypothetical protein